MDKDKKHEPIDPEQKKWDVAGPDQATGRAGGAGGRSYTEGEEAREERSTTKGDMKSGPLDQREGRNRDTQQGMAGSLGGPGAGTNAPATENERRFGGSHTAGKPVKKEEESEWKGGTPSQGPTTGGMGAAGGGHDTDETDVWGDKDRKKDK